MVSDCSHNLAARHSVRVLCTHASAVTKRYIDSGVAVTAIGSRFSFRGRPLSFEFIATLLKEDADIIHYHLPFPLATASSLLGKPRSKLAVATWHHDIVRYPYFNYLYRPLLRSFLRSLDAVVVGAQATVDNMSVLSEIRDKCHVIPLGIDETRFAAMVPQRVAEIQREFNGLPIVLFVGRLVYYKGLDILLKAMSGINARLVIIGTGPLENNLKELALNLGILDRVCFLGRIEETELINHYAACTLLALPSVGTTECYGLVQAEAMMCGKPVVNTNLPTGVPWVSLHELTGLTVEPGDVEALRGAINRLLSNQSWREELGKAAKIRAHQHFTLSAQCQSLESLYENLLEKADCKARHA